MCNAHRWGLLRALAVLVAATFTLAACGSASRTLPHGGAALFVRPVPRLLAVDVYRGDAAGDLSPVVRHDPALVYVPNSLSNTVDVINQRTMKIGEHFATGARPQPDTPSYGLRTLYVDNDLGNSLTPI